MNKAFNPYKLLDYQEVSPSLNNSEKKVDSSSNLLSRKVVSKLLDFLDML